MIEATKQGRPRILGDRYPSGQLKPRNKQPDGTPPAKIRRAVDLALHGAADPLLATPLGWLRLHGKLTDSQVAAGVAYAKLRGQADRAMGLTRRSIASPSYEVGYGSRGEDAPADANRKSGERFDGLRQAFLTEGSLFGVAATIDLLDHVCVLGHAPPYWHHAPFKRALDICCAFFGTGYTQVTKRGA
jgi:hypothetical protein